MDTLTKARTSLSQWFQSPALRLALLTFVILRLALSFWMWGVRQIFSEPIQPHPILRPYVGVTPEANPWLEPWQRWDVLHYQAIAERGYRAFDSALFAPPLYPWLMRALASLLGGNTLIAGMVVSNLAFLGCLIVLYQLAEYETGDPKLARRSMIYLACFPTAFFFMAAYAESLYVLATMLCLFLARQRKWWGAGVWGAIAALTRMPGVMILAPLTYAALESSLRERDWRAWISVALTLVGSALFPLYVWLALDQPPLTPWIVLRGRFQGSLAFPGVNVFETVRRILSGTNYVIEFFDLAFLLIFLFSTIFVWRHLHPIYAVYQSVPLVQQLSWTSALQPLTGAPRYVLTLFPAFIVFGIWGERPWVNRLILYPSWMGLLFLSGQFAIWGWIG